jgi:hypothetical protein
MDPKATADRMVTLGGTQHLQSFGRPSCRAAFFWRTSLDSAGATRHHVVEPIPQRAPVPKHELSETPLSMAAMQIPHRSCVVSELGMLSYKALSPPLLSSSAPPQSSCTLC